MTKAVSSEWVLNLLAGERYPDQGQAYDHVKAAIKDMSLDNNIIDKINPIGNNIHDILEHDILEYVKIVKPDCYESMLVILTSMKRRDNAADDTMLFLAAIAYTVGRASVVSELEGVTIIELVNSLQ
jgi:hypothetical protein